jgi:hypothetical protein
MAMRVTPELTRRRDPDAQQETWLIHYRDVRVRVISERAVSTHGQRRHYAYPDFCGSQQCACEERNIPRLGASNQTC